MMLFTRQRLPYICNVNKLPFATIKLYKSRQKLLQQTGSNNVQSKHQKSPFLVILFQKLSIKYLKFDMKHQYVY